MYLQMTLDSNREPEGVCKTGHFPFGFILRYQGVLLVMPAVKAGVSSSTPAKRATTITFSTRLPWP